MAKLAVFPKAYIEDLSNGKMDLFHWIQQASTLGVDGLEMYPRFLREYGETYLNSVRDAADAFGLAIPMMCSSPDFTHPDPTFRQMEIDRMKQMIDVMTILGPSEFRSCRVLSGQKRPEVSRDEGVTWTVDAIRQLLPYAKERRVHLVMENHYKDGFWVFPEFAQASDVFLEIIDQIHSSWFGVNYDPSNALVAAEDPLILLAQVKQRVVTMHASDRYIREGFTLESLKTHATEGYSSALAHGVIGQGMNDYDAIFKELSSVNFNGWISIEDGMNGLDDLRESAKFLRGKIEHDL